MNIVEKVYEIGDIQKAQEIFNALDLTELTKKVSEIVGTAIELKKEFKLSHNDTRYSIRVYCEQDLKSYCGFLALGVASIKIQDFGVYINKTVEYDQDIYNQLMQEEKYDECREIMNIKEYFVHIRLDARYELKFGGSNGISLLSADYYPETKTWNINIV